MGRLIAKISKREKIIKRIPIIQDEDVVEVTRITKGKCYHPIDKEIRDGVEMYHVIDDYNDSLWVSGNYFLM